MQILFIVFFFITLVNADICKEYRDNDSLYQKVADQSPLYDKEFNEKSSKKTKVVYEANYCRQINDIYELDTSNINIANKLSILYKRIKKDKELSSGIKKSFNMLIKRSTEDWSKYSDSSVFDINTSKFKLIF